MQGRNFFTGRKVEEVVLIDKKLPVVLQEGENCVSSCAKFFDEAKGIYADQQYYRDMVQAGSNDLPINSDFKFWHTYL